MSIHVVIAILVMFMLLVVVAVSLLLTSIFTLVAVTVSSVRRRSLVSPKEFM